MPFLDPALFLQRWLPKHLPQVPAQLSIQRSAPGHFGIKTTW
jgi:hypothetical protein